MRYIRKLNNQRLSQRVEAKCKTPASTAAVAAPAPEPARTRIVAPLTAEENKDNIPSSGRGKDNRRKNSNGKNDNGQAETLLLDVIINTERMPEIVRAEKLADGRLALPLDAWQAARLRLPEGGQLSLPDNQRGYPLESVPGLTYNLDRGRLALTITAPAAAFTDSGIDHGSGGESPPNLSPPGFYINYDVSATSSNLRYDGYGAFVEGVVFNRWGSAVSSMILRGDRKSNEAVRTETFFRIFPVL